MKQEKRDELYHRLGMLSRAVDDLRDAWDDAHTIFLDEIEEIRGAIIEDEQEQSMPHAAEETRG